MANSSTSALSFFLGDSVDVVGGDLVGIHGTVISHGDQCVTIKPSAPSQLQQEVTVLASQVQKHIPIHAHVKVMDGRYANETGTVVAICDDDERSNDPAVVVVTDHNHREVTVRTSQLCVTPDTATGSQDSLQGYHLHDLVATSQHQEWGIVIRVGQKDLSIMNQHGIVRVVQPEELRGKRNMVSHRTTYLDRNGAPLRQGSMVAVVGNNKGSSGTIKRLCKSKMFLFSPTHLENSGIMVVSSRNCVLRGSRQQQQNQTTVAVGVGRSLHVHGRPRQQRANKDLLVGKTVRVCSGKWKGYQGAVCVASTPTHVLIQLDSQPKKVQVVRERVVVVGDRYGSWANETGTATSGPAHPDDTIPRTDMPALGCFD